MRSRLFLPHPPATDGNARAAPPRLGTCLRKRSATRRHTVVHLHATRRDVRQSLDQFVVHLGTPMSTLGTSMSTPGTPRERHCPLERQNGHALVHPWARHRHVDLHLGHSIGTSVSTWTTDEAPARPPWAPRRHVASASAHRQTRARPSWACHRHLQPPPWAADGGAGVPG
jgi:hypothetical protein